MKMLYYNILSVFTLQQDKALQQISTKFLDKFGIWTSGLCAIHCLMMPLIVVFLPLIGASFLAAEWFESVILSISLIVGLWSTLLGFHKYHRRVYPILGIVVGGVVYWNKHFVGESLEPAMIALGAALIIAAHVSNYRLTQRARKHNEALHLLDEQSQEVEQDHSKGIA